MNIATVNINTAADATTAPLTPRGPKDVGGNIDAHASKVTPDAPSGDGSSRAIQALLKTIAQLERQLQQQQQQLQHAIEHSTPGDPSGAGAIQALQSGIAVTMGNLAVAQAELLQMMTNGDSTGNVVNTTA